MTDSRLSRQSCDKYLAKLRSGSFESNEGSVFCELIGSPNWMRIYFPEQKLPLSQVVLELAEKVLCNLADLDRVANSDSNAKEYEPYLMDIYIYPDGEIKLDYCSEIENTGWGAFFRKNANGEIEFVELG